jgi:hypothetical protein
MNRRPCGSLQAVVPPASTPQMVPPTAATPPSPGTHVADRIATDGALTTTNDPIGQGDNTIQGQPIRPLAPAHSITVGGAGTPGKLLPVHSAAPGSMTQALPPAVRK